MHAGLGNFRDIDVEDLTKHKMDSEQMFVNAEACRIVNEAKDRGNKVCAIGTTVMRAIETAVGTDGQFERVRRMDQQIYFPSLRLLSSQRHGKQFPHAAFYHADACMCLRRIRTDHGAYNIALKEDYRFGTYGDAMLILDK